MLVALDVGSHHTRLAQAGKDDVLCEPTLVANCTGLPLGVATGQVASPVLGRAPERVSVFQPVVQGHLAAPGALCEQLRQMLKRKGIRSWMRPAARLVLPSVATPLERKQWAELLKGLGFASTKVVQMPVAVAWGGSDATEPAVAVIDVGSSVTEMALVAADVVLRRSIAWGGDDLELTLSRYLYQEHGLEVSRSTARGLKHGLSCWRDEWREGDTVEVRGRELASGLPVYRDISSAALGAALSEPLERLVELARGTLDEMPPLLAESVLQQGVLLTGGGSYLQGLDAFLHDKIDLAVRRAARAGECAVLGALKVRPELAQEP